MPKKRQQNVPYLLAVLLALDWVSSCVDHRLTFLRRPGTSSRVVLIFYVHFAPAGLLFFRNLFSPFFFCDVARYLTKKRSIVLFFFARVCESLIIVQVSYDTNNYRKIVPPRHFLFSCRPQLSRQPTGAQGSASAAESIPILEGGSARAKRGVGLAGVRA